MPDTSRLSTRNGKDLISSVFIAIAIAMIFTSVVGVAATIIDGIITSRLVGVNAYSGIALLSPLISTILLFSSVISSGGQVVITKAVGTGDNRTANSVFNFSLLGGIAVSFLFILTCWLIPGTLFRICGVSLDKYPYLFDEMMAYLHGYMPGMPAMVLVQIIGPIIVLDGGRKRFTISSIVFCVIDISADLLNALVLMRGSWGMGMATSVSYWVQFVILATHFLSKQSYFKPSFRDIGFRKALEVAKDGAPAFARRLCSILRDLVTNNINIAVAVSAAAIAARGLQGDLNLLMFCIGTGIGKALLSITGIYHSAEDRKGLKRLFSYSMKASVIIPGIAGVILFFTAPFIARFYTQDPEVIELSVFSIRSMAVGLPMDTIAVAYQSYLQGIHKRKLLNSIIVLERLVIPVLVAFVMGRYFGSRGVMASLAISKIVLVLFLYAMIAIHVKHLPTHIDDFMFIPDDFGGAEQDNIYARLRTIEEINIEKDKAYQFCMDHGISHKKSLYCALFIEEMAGNIVLHGKRKNRKSRSVPEADFRMFVNEGKVSITLRDYCKMFNPQQYLELHDDPVRALGIKMVIKLASDVRYFNAFNSNNVIILLD